MDVDEIARMILLRVHQRNLNLFYTQGRVKKIELMLRGCDLVRITKLNVLISIVTHVFFSFEMRDSNVRLEVFLCGQGGKHTGNTKLICSLHCYSQNFNSHLRREFVCIFVWALI